MIVISLKCVITSYSIHYTKLYDRNDEFSYFSINTLKSSLQAYNNQLAHTLLITDACESGPTFYQAMRGAVVEKSCGDWQATKLKSSQVFTSAGYELALDNSQFTKTFANMLANNPNSCIPIESIVVKVTRITSYNVCYTKLLR